MEKFNLIKKVMEDLKKVKDEVMAGVKTEAEKHAQKILDERLEALNKEVTEKMSLQGEELVKAKEEISRQVKELSAELKKSLQTEKVEAMTLKDSLRLGILENADKIKGLALKGEVSEKLNKDVGVMNITGHTTNFTPFMQEVRNDLILKPATKVWLADYLLQSSSESNSVIFPKEGTGTGSVGQWTRGSNKTQIDFKLISQTVSFKWIAGFVLVDVDMLQDIKFLSSYISNKLLTQLRVAENDFILNGDQSSYQGLLDAAQAYAGDYTILGDQVVSAAYGEIPDATQGAYTGDTVFLNPKTAVAIGLNKAEGSGAYNLPNGSIGFANGQLNIAGLNVASVSDIADNKFLAFDKEAAMFIRRTTPTLEMFVDATLAKANQVMFRIEERVGLAIFNDDALIKIA